jgi:hypothetical protein
MGMTNKVLDCNSKWSQIQLEVTSKKEWPWVGMRHSAASKDMNMEADKATMVEAITKREPVKTTDWDDLAHVIMNCKMHKLETAL